MDMNSVRKAGVGLALGMEPNAMNAAKITSADSENHNKHARNTHIMMTQLVARCIHLALTKELNIQGDPAAEETGEVVPRPQKKSKRSKSQEASDYKLSDLLEDTEEKCHLHTGIIRQGRRPIHQSLHIDNDLLLNGAGSTIVNKIYAGADVTAGEWLQLGYVVDMPLSQEGSWLRVAIPDPTTKTFLINWIYIPYGSMLIRSMALLHGGHYGDPGNCRYHGTFTMHETPLDTKKLGHIDRMDKSKKLNYTDWGLVWHADIPAVGYEEDGYNRITCKKWSAAKKGGSTYFNSFVKPNMNHKVGLNILKNLSPGEGLVTAIKKKAKFSMRGKFKLGSALVGDAGGGDDDDDDDDDDGKDGGTPGGTQQSRGDEEDEDDADQDRKPKALPRAIFEAIKQEGGKDADTDTDGGAHMMDV
jgi:hypothetical protein